MSFISDIKGDKKEDLIKEMAEIMGVEPEVIEANRKYSVKELELIKSFWLYIHREEKSKHFDSIGALLALSANEEGGCHVEQ